MMKSTIATIIGTAALGLLKEKLGSSAKIKKQQLKVIKVPEMWMKTYATNLDYLGIDINRINDYDSNQLNRLFLFPIENSPLIKSAGLFLEGMDISDEDEELGDLYSIYWIYVIEPHDQNMVLNQQTLDNLKDTLDNLKDIYHEVCLAFNAAQEKVIDEDVAYDDSGEFGPGDMEEFMEYKGKQFKHELDYNNKLSSGWGSSVWRVISIPIFTIEKNGKKIKLNEYKQTVKKNPKLRRR